MSLTSYALPDSGAGTLGKAPITLGKSFAECNTRQRVLGKDFVSKGYSVKILALGKEKHSAKCKSEKNPTDETGKIKIY
jgi:hypothetical protein